MNPVRFTVVATAVLWLMAGCQAALAPHLAFWGAGPDFLVVALGTLGVFWNRRASTVVGFWAGLLQGAVSGASLAGAVISRTVAGFLVGAFTDSDIEPSPFAVALSTAVATVIVNLLQLLTAPPPGIAAYLGATIISALVNGVLAVPLFWSLRRILLPRRQ